jgi:hypothetical protein
MSRLGLNDRDGADEQVRHTPNVAPVTGFLIRADLSVLELQPLLISSLSVQIEMSAQVKAARQWLEQWK